MKCSNTHLIMYKMHDSEGIIQNQSKSISGEINLVIEVTNFE